jgi:hypothetical protein
VDSPASVSVQPTVTPSCPWLDTYLLLASRGWTPQRWEQFVVGSLTHALVK